MSTFYAREHRRQPRNERWRSKRDHRIMATRNCQAKGTRQREARKVQGPFPCFRLSQANRAQMNDFDIFPVLTQGRTQSRLDITVPVRYYRNYIVILSSFKRVL